MVKKKNEFWLEFFKAQIPSTVFAPVRKIKPLNKPAIYQLVSWQMLGLLEVFAAYEGSMSGLQGPGASAVHMEWVAVIWPNRSAPRSAGQAVKAGFIILYRAPPGLPLTLRTTPQIWLLIPILKWETEAQRGRGSPHPWPRS